MPERRDGQPALDHAMDDLTDDQLRHLGAAVSATRAQFVAAKDLAKQLGAERDSTVVHTLAQALATNYAAQVHCMAIAELRNAISRIVPPG